MIRLKSILATAKQENDTNHLVKEQLLKDSSLIDQVINDTNVLVVNNLKTIKDILSKEPLDKEKLKIALNNYKRYFNRDNGGTPEVIRGMTFQKELENLLK
jgi:hypothetical protein